MVSIRLYVEGGGDAKALRTECRKGFNEFLQKAGFQGRMPRIVACGGRQNAYDSFFTAIGNIHPNDVCLLLVDSEAPVTVASPWVHIKNRPDDGWEQPSEATDDHCHLMVQCMESWFLADKDAMEVFFGKGYHGNSLPGNPNIEAIAKTDVYSSIQAATMHCKTKKAYGKGEHSFKLLAKIDPAKVGGASPWAKRFIDTLQRFAG